ncbi:LPXTG cell wall anchor domain-containing protein [Actinoplanes utahensis]|uniref:Gram-positive cocci surface proteins LPxTG domain-containing protein n=1 Tax=Actinoplanes utahensis TaxID=1869 RepID=A0A0A6UNK0_ACTUT|nr:LPXTG cell wall anchor domain-containing protein [Actinoplanes utahensis]KHD75884.1 hypothetical protein MB27_19685 [Actinoplanes utahensis]GIF34969.1 hypothetical protein Aut01nite_79550 [Actinoplanes utahensis]
MSFSRRLAAGLPTVGATVLVALALGGAPASAAADLAGKAGHAIITPSPGPGDQRGNAGYGDVQQAPEAPAGPAAVATVPPAGGAPATTATGPTRGKPGYGPGEAPSETPSETPSQTPSTPTGTVTQGTPGGALAETVTPVPGATTGGAGVSSGETLPLTGDALGGTLAVGGLLVAGGAAAVLYSRRRRNA